MKPSRIAVLYRNELAKHFRQRFLYVALILIGLIAVIWTRNADLIAPVSGINGHTALVLGIIGVTSLIALLSLIFSAMLVAGETSGGTFRMILPRPITRAEFLSAKILMGVTFSVLLIVFYIFVSLVSSIGIYSFGPIIEDQEVVMTTGVIAGQLALALLFTLLPLMAAVSYGIFMSVLSRSLATAIGASIGILLALDIIKHIFRVGDFMIKPYIFTTYFDEFLKIAQDYAQGLEVVWFDPDPEAIAIIVPIMTVAILTSLSFIIFLRRDLND